jgi:3-oxoacyl-(acyl-carrier-protein) synthase/NAD(P)-dependent dehydrogenase (short-subunit alcohol dehydrogenase family)/acyl carrier protein
MSQTIAVVGIDVELPGAPTFEAAGRTERAARTHAGLFPASRLADASLASAPEDHYQGCYFERIDLFDHRYFRVSARVASMMDPFQRWCLLSSARALADAGLLGSLEGSRTGVYASCNTGQQRLYEALQRGHGTSPDLMSVLSSSIAARISFLFDLRGPAMMVDTACSSSLAAAVLACTDLAAGRVDTAIVTSANLYLDPGRRGSAAIDVVSERGVTRAFDLAADGTSVGEGVITVVLRRADDVDEATDVEPYGHLLGWASGQDGRTATMAAPNPVAQTDVIDEAWTAAGSPAERLTLLVTHGTGTEVGDAIELDALAAARALARLPRGSVALTSTKTAFGHLDAASGLLSLCLALSALGSGEAAPHPTFRAPGLDLDLADSPFFVPTEVTPLAPGGVAGVSSFGLTGTNVHVVVAGAGRRKPDARRPVPHSPQLPVQLQRYWYPLERNTFDKGDETVVEALGVRSVVFRLETFRDWEIAEHRVQGVQMMVGTSVLEIISRLLAGSPLDLRSFDVTRLQILRPLTATQARLDVLASVNLETLTGELSSREGTARWSPWVRFALEESTAATGSAPMTARPPSEEGMVDVPVRTVVGDGSVVSVSARWEVVDTLRHSPDGEHSVLGLTCPGSHAGEFLRYHFYPALIDAAVNGANALLGEGTVLLPWYCERLSFHQDQLRGRRFTSHIALSSMTRDVRGNVVASLDVDLWDEHGEPVLSLRGYRVKNRVADGDLQPAFHQVGFVADVPPRSGLLPSAAVVLPDGADPEPWSAPDRWLVTWSAVLAGADIGPVSEVVVVGGPPAPVGAEAGEVAATVADRAWQLCRLLACLQRFEQVRRVTLLAPGAFAAKADPATRAWAMAGHSLRTELRFDVAVLDAPATPASVQPVEDAVPAGLLRLGADGALRRARFEPLALEATASWPRDTDVTVLVVGASSGIGRAYAEYLSRSYPRARVVGCGRRRMRAGELGFEYLRADVTREDDVHRLAASLGHVRHVVMFAGERAQGLFVTKEREDFGARMQSKVAGSDLLLAGFGEADQIVLISSVAGHVGAMGQAEYAAANAYQSALARAAGGGRVRCLALGGWADIGMARDLADDVFVKTPPHVGLPLVHAFVMSSTPEASLFAVTSHAPAYSTLFAAEPGQLPADRVPDPSTPSAHPAGPAQPARSTQSAGPAPSEPSGAPHAGDADDVRKRVGAAWIRVLGEDEYTPDVSFFDYGGDSVSIVQLCQELNQEFPGAFDVTTLFSETTIAAQAQVVTGTGGRAETASPGVDIRDLQRLLDSPTPIGA